MGQLCFHGPTVDTILCARLSYHGEVLDVNSRARNAWLLSQRSRRFLLAGLDVFRACGVLELARLIAAKVSLLDEMPRHHRHLPAADLKLIMMARPHRHSEGPSRRGRADCLAPAHDQVQRWNVDDVATRQELEVPAERRDVPVVHSLHPVCSVGGNCKGGNLLWTELLRRGWIEPVGRGARPRPRGSRRSKGQTPSRRPHRAFAWCNYVPAGHDGHTILCEAVL